MPTPDHQPPGWGSAQPSDQRSSTSVSGVPSQRSNTTNGTTAGVLTAIASRAGDRAAARDRLYSDAVTIFRSRGDFLPAEFDNIVAQYRNLGVDVESALEEAAVPSTERPSEDAIGSARPSGPAESELLDTGTRGETTDGDSEQLVNGINGYSSEPHNGRGQ